MKRVDWHFFSLPLTHSREGGWEGGRSSGQSAMLVAVAALPITANSFKLLSGALLGSRKGSMHESRGDTLGMCHARIQRGNAASISSTNFWHNGGDTPPQTPARPSSPSVTLSKACVLFIPLTPLVLFTLATLGQARKAAQDFCHLLRGALFRSFGRSA